MLRRAIALCGADAPGNLFTRRGLRVDLVRKALSVTAYAACMREVAMPEKHTENAAPPAERARRVLHVRRRRGEPAAPQPQHAAPRPRRMPVVVASLAAIALSLLTISVYVVVRQEVLFAPSAASAELAPEKR